MSNDRQKAASAQSHSTISLGYKLLCERALRGLPHLVFRSRPAAHRTVRRSSPPRDDNAANPTATSHIVLALADCGVQYTSPYRDTATIAILSDSTSFDLSTKRFDKMHHLVAFIETFLTQSPNETSTTATNTLAAFIKRVQAGGDNIDTAQLGGTAASWVGELFNQSMHCKAERPSLRECTLYGHLLPAVIATYDAGYTIASPYHDWVFAGALWIIARIKKLLDNDIPIGTSWGFRPGDTFVSPYLLLNAVLAMDAARRIVKIVAVTETAMRRFVLDGVDEVLGRLKVLFETIVDKLMARRTARGDPYYDVVSLVFALRGLAITDRAIKSDAYFNECLRAIVSGQLENGLWPDGIAIAEIPGTTSVQQPSVEIALNLAEAVWRDGVLVQPTPTDLQCMNTILPALRCHADYLYSSRQALHRRGSEPVYGWSSDRSRAPDIIETWISALATRFLCKAYLIDRACRRAEILERYRVVLAGESDDDNDPAASAVPRWESKVIENDSITKPVDTIAKRFIQPIMEQAKRGRGLRRPAHRAVSFLLYGPPGSGKTFLVNALASCLGWPLVSLNPGNFILRGLERIEHTAAKVFGDLSELDHCVVFFDECDELFRDRRASQENQRNILSFATASMLPKLQQLHHERRVVFVVATNYLRNIDDAIRRVGRFDGAILYDRPDQIARRQIAERVRKDAGLSAASASDLDIFAGATSGLTYDEIAELCLRTPLQPPSPAALDAETRDYVEWCLESGRDEIKAGRLSDADVEAVLTRWRTLPGWREPKKRRKLPRRTGSASPRTRRASQ